MKALQIILVLILLFNSSISMGWARADVFSQSQTYPIERGTQKISQFVEGDQHWETGFHQPGATNLGSEGGLIAAIATAPNGDLYVGGCFDTIGGILAKNIARWDGTVWSPLSSGMDDCVDALALDGTGGLFAGGFFLTAGGITANRIAHWNGNVWTPLGSGMNRSVSSLSLTDFGELYAGGAFTTAGGQTANHIARWDGNTWSALGLGIDLGVYALVGDESGNLFAGGSFTSAGGVAASNIARWNGSAWSALGAGTNGSVSTLALDDGGNLYAGGNFTMAGGNIVNRIASWDGSAWTSLSSGIEGSNAWVGAIIIDQNDYVYAAGNFVMAGGVAANRIARWDGNDWMALASGFNNYEVYSLAKDGSGLLFAGGSFNTAGDVVVNGIAGWDGQDWSPLVPGNGLWEWVFSVEVTEDGEVYAGGAFTAAGTRSVNNIARFDGNQWEPLGDGLDQSVWAIVRDGVGNLYAGGLFTSTGELLVNHIARWDGYAWSPLGDGVNGSVNALAVDDLGNLYAGGYFTSAGAVPVNYIARWDGVEWMPMGVGMNGGVSALAVDRFGNVYAGGNFTSAGGAPANHIARWDGSEWAPLNEGTDSAIYSLALDETGLLIAGGDFTIAGNISADYIASWDGVTWSPLGDGMDGVVYALAAEPGGGLFAGGNFTAAGGNAANRIARWDGSTWSPLGSGINNLWPNNYILDLALVSNGDLYAVGEFSSAGESVSARIAHWTNVAPVATGDSFEVVEDSLNSICDVLANDSDFEDDPLAIDSVGASQHSGSILYSSEWITYTPATDFYGSDVFTYTVSDGVGGYTTSLITVTVIGVNDPPIIGSIISPSVAEGDELTMTIMASDADLPDQTLNFVLEEAPLGAGISPVGLFTWTPSEDQGPGIYPITVWVEDDGFPSESASQTFTVTVSETNIAPLAADDSYTALEDTPLKVDAPGVLANDSDPDLPLNPLNIVLENEPEVGTLDLLFDGSFVYTPTLNQQGVITFSYTITDGLLTDTGLVLIVVENVNDPPQLGPLTGLSVEVGETFTVTGTIVDPDTQDDHELVIMWAEDETHTIWMDSGVTSFSVSYVYSEAGEYQVTINVRDPEGMQASASITISVAALSKYKIFLPQVHA